MSPAKPIWLDCDPGHDDALALLLAIFSPRLSLIGCSTVGGNAPVQATFTNAARLLVFYGTKLPPRPDDVELLQGEVHLFMGSALPLLKEERCDPGIHGEDGLGGVIGLPSSDSPEVKRRIWASYGPEVASKGEPLPPNTPSHLLLYWHKLLSYRITKGLPRITIVATGPLTNIALLVKAFPELVEQGVEEVVIMGGAPPGTRGNRGPLAEFNILVDPESASILFDHPIRVVMAGLNVTHQAIFTPAHRCTLLSTTTTTSSSSPIIIISPFRQTLDSILTFFAETYRIEFGFRDGPPVHDLLAVAWLIDPKIFYGAGGQEPLAYNVQVECTKASLALGATVVDFSSGVLPSQVVSSSSSTTPWAKGGPNVLVLEHVHTDSLWNLFFQCVQRTEDLRCLALPSGGETN